MQRFAPERGPGGRERVHRGPGVRERQCRPDVEASADAGAGAGADAGASSGASASADAGAESGTLVGDGGASACRVVRGPIELPVRSPVALAVRGDSLDVVHER